MAELQISYEDLRRHISRYIGAGRVESDYSSITSTLADINDIMLGGLRSFCWPVIDPKEGIAHRWTFLEVDRTIKLVSGQSNYPLDPGFSRLTDQFSYPDEAEQRNITPTKYRYLRSLRSMDAKSGAPLYSAVQILETTQEVGSTKYEVVFYPTPDATVAGTVLTYSCEIEPYIPGDYDQVVPFGGAKHAETIIAACLAQAEGISMPEAGPAMWTERFKSLLLASIEIDRQDAEEQAEAMLWPTDALTGGVTSLAVTKSQLERLIGRELRFTAHPKAWNFGQASTVAEVLRNGLRKFYQPMVLQGESESHQWSFLHPVWKMFLVDGKSTYDLPEDFAVVTGDITYAPASSISYPRIALVAEDDVRWTLQSTAESSRPSLAATRVKHSNPTAGTRYEIMFAPTPGEDIAIEIPYTINPEQLGSDQALPMGGQPHAQTLIEACLAAVEIQMKSGNDHQQEFERCLRTSISHDRKVNAPQTLGYSHDASDGPYDGYRYRDRYVDDNQLTTYNGAAYWP